MSQQRIAIHRVNEISLFHYKSVEYFTSKPSLTATFQREITGSNTSPATENARHRPSDHRDDYSAPVNGDASAALADNVDISLLAARWCFVMKSIHYYYY